MYVKLSATLGRVPFTSSRPKPTALAFCVDAGD